ncbi:MAG: iron ABC transporter permease [Myxococcota bacterium]
MSVIEKNKPAFTTFLLLLSLFTLLLASSVGAKSISFADAFQSLFSAPDANGKVFWQIRFPRVLLSYLAGSALAISGMVFQAMFRNPLATPFTLGVASGASLGAAAYVRLGIAISLFGVSGISLFAFLGALFSITIVYFIARIKRGFSTATMLLAGIALNFFFSSLIMFTQYVSDFSHSYRILRWLMGQLETVGYDAVLDLFPFVVLGSGAVFYLNRELNLLTTGEEMAATRGVEVKRTKTVLFFVTSFMVGGVVAACGPIGFVGMMTPHILRLLIGSDHKYLAPATLLFGGVFLTLCDTVARTIIAPAELPVGVITALLGGPFFIWLLLTGGPEKNPA